MKTLMNTAAATAIVLGYALPAAAMDDMMDVSGVTCGDFMAMSSDGQADAMDAMKMAAKHPDGMMADDGMATDDMESDSMESDDMESEDDIGSDDMMKEHMAAMKSACEGNDDMKAMDAMSSAMDM